MECVEGVGGEGMGVCGGVRGWGWECVGDGRETK